MISNEVKNSSAYAALDCPKKGEFGSYRSSNTNASDFSDDSFEANAGNRYSSEDNRDEESSPFSCINTSSSSVTSVENSPMQSFGEAFAAVKQPALKFHAQNEFLEFIDSAPARPPSYCELPPGGCPRFPIFDMDYGNEYLPGYSPAAYKVGVCSRKQEWLSPYEVAPTRSWKNVIMELNSTQLNVYSIPSQLDATLSNIRINENNQSRPSTSSFEPNLNSLVTTKLDMEVRKVCDKLRLFDLSSPLNLESSDLDETPSSYSQSSAHKVLKVCKQKKLLRSYSLQYAKIGLASDYTKKPNVLRLRLENEQFLLCFPSTKEMIEWNLAFSIGKDVALDLTEREIPKYRTVPRRRSLYSTRNTPFFNEVVTRRMRSRSEPIIESSSSASLRGKISKLKTKIVTPAGLNNSKAIMTKTKQNDLRKPCTTSPTVTSQNTLRQRQSSSSIVNAASFSINSDDELPFEESESSNREEDEEDIEADMQNTSYTRGSDEDEEFENDFDEFLGSRFPEDPMGSRETENEKWAPLMKIESRRRYLRNCVKCIRPLGFDDSWTNKSLVKPTTMTPLTTMYVRNQYVMRDSSYSSLSDLGEESIFSIGAENLRRRSGGREALYNLPDTSLARIPHHNLKEYSVGAHSLIPKIL